MADESLFHQNIAWLKDFRRRFDAEVKHLYETETFWLACQRCASGYCCAHQIFPVAKTKGNPFSAEEWWLQLEYVRDHFSPAEKKQLIQNIASRRPDCIFLFGNRCAVHPARTWACRVHPYVVNYHPAPSLFPVGELALPSCPPLASSFDIKIDEHLTQKPAPGERRENLVKVKLRKHKPLWLIDASAYVKEYQAHVAVRRERPIAEWREVIDLAREAGGEDGDVLAAYVALTQGLTIMPDGRVGYEA